MAVGDNSLQSRNPTVVMPEGFAVPTAQWDSNLLEWVPAAAASGGDGAILDGASAAIKATVKDYANSNPLAVVTVDTNGDPVSASGGTQYTEGDVDATITGTAAMMEVAGNTLQPVQGTVADGLLVNLGANNDVTVASLPLPTGAATSALQLPDGHNVTVDNAAGAAAVNVQDGGNSLTVDGSVTANAGTDLNTSALNLEATQADVRTAVQLIDDIVHASDAALGKVAAIGAQFDDVAPGTTTENNVRPLRMSTRRELYGQVRDAAGNERGANVNASNAMLVAQTGELPAGTQNIGDVDIVSLPNEGQQTMANSISVAIASDQSAVTVAQATPANLKCEPAGNVAHAAADSGNPIKIGAKVETSLEGVTLAADGNRTDLYADADGQLLVKLNAPNGDLTTERVSNTDGASTAFTNFGNVASTRNYVTTITVFRTDAGTSMEYVDFRDGTAGAILWSMPLPPNGGSTVSGAMPLFRTSAATALAYDVSNALTTVYISVSGFQSKA